MRPSRKNLERERERTPQTRINEMIRVREVLLIDENDENLGVKRIEEAQQFAMDRELDLVEISPQARPPVCRVMDFGKWKYEQNVKEKQARKGRSQISIKEIKFRPKIGAADYETKKNHVRRFLEHEDKVKVTIMFRGREVVHSDLGRKILDRVAVDVADIANVESSPNLEGRNMTMMLGPIKKREAAPKREETDDVLAPAATEEVVADTQTPAPSPKVEKPKAAAKPKATKPKVEEVAASAETEA